MSYSNRCRLRDWKARRSLFSGRSPVSLWLKQQLLQLRNDLLLHFVSLPPTLMATSLPLFYCTPRRTPALILDHRSGAMNLWGPIASLAFCPPFRPLDPFRARASISQTQKQPVRSFTTLKPAIPPPGHQTSRTSHRVRNVQEPCTNLVQRNVQI